MAKASIKDILHYFGFRKSSDFMREWKQLSDEEKEYFKEAIGEVLDKSKLKVNIGGRQ